MRSTGKFQLLVRLGYLARGLVYVLLGYLALSSREAVKEGPRAVFSFVQDMPVGSLLLYLSALGLLGYALFRFASTFLDIEHHGTGKTGIAKRLGHLGSGVAHVVLAYTAFQFANGGGSGGGDTAQQAARTVLSVDFGSLALGLLGICLFGAALFQGKKAVTASFMKRVTADAPSAAKPIGQGGHAARAVVFAIIGWSLVDTAWLSPGAQIKTLGDAIASLADNGLVFTLVAVGLLMFGVFSLILSRYRIIPDLDSCGRPAFG